MDKLERGLIALLVALVVAVGGYAAVNYVFTLRTALVQATKDAKTAQDALKKVQATLALRESKRLAAEASARSANASLQSVLQQNRAWAEQPVPQEVTDDLCKTLRCSPDPGAATGVRNPDDSP